MRREDLDLTKYKSDKLDYLKYYDPIFLPFLDMHISLLELGILEGASLLLWKDYFINSNIVGIDIHLPDNFQPPERIKIFEGSQDDTLFLTTVANSTAPNGFDIIIDDASHLGELSKKSFWHLFNNHLKPGGIYAIEDWGTGYWEDWPDGAYLDLDEQESKFGKVSKKPLPCHSNGMVGFIKQLIDEQGAIDVTRDNKNRRPSKFERLIIYPGLVFVIKRNNV